MLSNPLHRYSTYNAMSSNMLSNSRLPSQNHNSSLLHSSGLDHLGHGSQHALQQLQQNIDLHQNAQRNNSRHRQHPYHNLGNIHTNKANSLHGSNSGGPVRRRISRACDQCNQLRTKCDGQGPCAHCVEFGLGCEYIRERKKRGKASRKDLAAQQAAAAAGGAPKSPSGRSSDGQSPSESRAENLSSNNSSTNDTHETHRSGSGSSSLVNGVLEGRIMEQDIGQDSYRSSMRGGRLEIMTEFPIQHQPHMISHRAGSMTGSMTSEQTDSPIGLGLTGYSSLHGYGRPTTSAHLLNGNGSSPSFHSTQVNLPGYADLPYSMQSPSNYPGTSTGSFRLGESPLGFSMNDSPGPSPGWMSLPSPSATQYTQSIPQQAFNASPRYPVLQPLIPHLGSIIPVSLACDLLDLYFATSSSAHIHPMSPYVLGYVFRKRSFLHPSNPRTCSPALLASMLWVAAQTSDAAILTASPSARGRVCQGLLELTVSLLKPLIHGPPPGDDSPNFLNTVINGVALGGLGVSMSESSASDIGEGSAAFGASGALDDVVTYIHLATVISASEYKAASLRWWNAAWSLARELKLGRELPTNMHDSSSSNDIDADGESDTEGSLRNGRRSNQNPLGTVTEEDREERRRIWWLLFCVDRHLSLCYNKPLFLLDSECDSLFQPMDDSVFQSGNFEQQSTSSNAFEADPNQDPSLDSGLYINSRRRGPGFECTGHSIFGYFLPLMTILGEIVDLKMARNHPRFGTNSPFRSAQEWENQSAEITRQLEAYGRSLVEFEKKHLGNQDDTRDEGSQAGEGSVHSTNTSSSYVTSSAIRTRIVLAYSTHVMHVLHILLTGKWDPISLLDDADLWISSDSFVTSTSHAVSAAEAINSILEWDEGLEFMPFFFGVYLLQGSFLLLLIADKLGVEASARVIGACEGVVRAIEACVVTLNTEYQRNFRKVMRSALAQVRGRCPEDWVEQHKRRREVLMLYRWTPDGTGLAL